MTGQRRQVAVRARARLRVQESCGGPNKGLHSLVACEHDRQDGEETEENALRAVAADTLVPLFVRLVIVANGERLVFSLGHGGRHWER